MKKNVLMKLDRITRTYQMGEVAVHALKETSLDILEGELLVILGPSGSGKSTLLNIIGGMDSPSSGEIFFGKENLASAGEQRLTRYRREEVGFVFQFYNLIPDLTAKETWNWLPDWSRTRFLAQVLRKWAWRTGWATFLPS